MEVGFYEPWWMQILKAIAIFFVVFNLVPLALLADRKVLGRFQHRYGPNRVGPFGLLQAIADIGKLVFKAQFRPADSNGWLFAVAPVISMMTAAAQAEPAAAGAEMPPSAPLAIPPTGTSQSGHDA